MKKSKFLKVLCFALVVASLCSFFVFGVSAAEEEIYTFDSSGKLTLTAGYYHLTGFVSYDIFYGENRCDVYCCNSAYGSSSSYFGIRKLNSTSPIFVDFDGNFSIYIQSYEGDTSTGGTAAFSEFSYILVTDTLDLSTEVENSNITFTKYSDLYSYTFTRGVYGVNIDQNASDQIYDLRNSYGSDFYFTFNQTISEQAANGHSIDSKIYRYDYEELDDIDYYMQLYGVSLEEAGPSIWIDIHEGPRYTQIDPQLELHDYYTNSSSAEYFEDASENSLVGGVYYVTDTYTLHYLCDYHYDVLNNVFVKTGGFPGDTVLTSILSVALRVVLFLGTFVVLLCGIFYIDGSLTVIGYLAIGALAIAVILLVVYLITRFLKYRG